MRILYVDVDSLRPDHLGCYGYDRDTSPNVDALAADGRRFTNYYASDVPCLPSRTGLSTCRFGIHTGVINHGGVNGDPRSQGESRGFRGGGEYRTFPAELHRRGFDTALVSPFPQRHGAWNVLEGFEEWFDTGSNGSETADVVFEHAEKWLDGNAADDDWYLHVNFWDPHTLYDTPEEYGNPFADDPAPDWLTEERIAEQYASYGPHSAHDPHHSQYHDGEAPDLPRMPDEVASREEFDQWVDGYDVGVRYMDDYLGRLLDLLREEGVFEETLILVSADHGENLGELNVYGDHQTADQYTCRVPLVVRGPGVEPGVDDGFHYNVDLGPTLTDLVDGETAEGWDGTSFADSVTEGADAGRDFLVLSQGAWAGQRAVRWDDWLLVRTYHDGLKAALDPVMLFDLSEDPHETENLARERPEVAEEGLATLESWHADRMLEVARDRAGGNADAPRAAADPMWEMLHEGGPYHTRNSVEQYANRLRETGREEHAAEVERREGYVEESARDYLD